MSLVIPVLDADIRHDAHRLVQRMMGMHPDVPLRAVAPYPHLEAGDVDRIVATKCAAAAVAADAPPVTGARHEWWVTPAPEQRHLLILGQLEPHHHDRLRWAHGETTEPPSAAFALFMRVRDGVMSYVRVRAPREMFAGTILDGDLVATPSGEAHGAYFQVHDLLGQDGVPVPPAPRSHVDARMREVAAHMTLSGVGLAPTVHVAAWQHVARGAPCLQAPTRPLLFANEYRVIDVTAPTRDMLVWLPPTHVPLGLTHGAPHAFCAPCDTDAVAVAEEGAAGWQPLPALPLTSGPWSGTTGVYMCALHLDTWTCTPKVAAADRTRSPITWNDIQAAMLPTQFFS
jgi:hypothetical protein